LAAVAQAEQSQQLAQMELILLYQELLLLP
jgi:hypothetical protein